MSIDNNQFLAAQGNSSASHSIDQMAHDASRDLTEISDLPEMMTAATISKYGKPSVFQLEQLPVPQVNPDQVLIRVCAASINPIDYRIRQGQLKVILPAKFPLTLGYDISGEVVAIGSDVRDGRLSIGDEVFSFSDNRHGGGYAEYVAVGSKVVVAKPKNLTHAEAAAIPLAATTALQSLRDLAEVRPGHRVLINGASGGVGHFAVQLANKLGGKVTGVCSHSNREFVLGLGAVRVIDYNVDDFTKQDVKYDIILDAVAKSSYRRCRRVLKSGGVYITTVPSAASFLFRATSWFGRKCRIVLARPNQADLITLQEAAENELMLPTIFETFPLAEVARAHEVSEGHHVRGKLVLS